MKPKFQSVPSAESVPMLEAKNACVADSNENKIDLIVGGRFDRFDPMFLLYKKYGRTKPHSHYTHVMAPTGMDSQRTNRIF
jgi:aspartate/tyrosine/aromatic aminotransferase